MRGKKGRRGFTLVELLVVIAIRSSVSRRVWRASWLTSTQVSAPTTATLTTTINRAANHPMLNVPTIGVSASTTLIRSEWGLGAYVPAVSDDVELSIEVELLSE